MLVLFLVELRFMEIIVLSHYVFTSFHSQSDQNAGSLKEELRKTVPQLEEMRKRKSDRKNQFLEVLDEIRNISNEIQGTLEYISSKTVDETDLSLRKLEELHRQLHALQTEKVELFYNISSVLTP